MSRFYIYLYIKVFLALHIFIVINDEQVSFIIWIKFYCSIIYIMNFSENHSYFNIFQIYEICELNKVWLFMTPFEVFSAIPFEKCCL